MHKAPRQKFRLQQHEKNYLAYLFFLWSLYKSKQSAKKAPVNNYIAIFFDQTSYNMRFESNCGYCADFFGLFVINSTAVKAIYQSKFYGAAKLVGILFSQLLQA